jgi:type IV pilus assembly protein PilN
MIRINLVAERKPLKPARSFAIGQKVTLAGSLLLILTALLGGWRYWSTSQEEARLAMEIEAARREDVRLAEALKHVAALEAQRVQWQRRVSLIDELRRGQTAPVHIIDQISRSLPELTWLTSLRQDGYDVTLEGHCTSLTALSDFVGNLEATRYFRRPVEIVMSEVVAAQGAPSTSAGELIRFAIKGTFRMAGLESSAPNSVPPGGPVD